MFENVWKQMDLKTNRDRFSQRVNMFRAEVKQFMVRPPEFDAV